MRWTLIALVTKAFVGGRRSRVVLMPRRRHQVCKSFASDGDKKADHRGEHGISRKPLRAGMSGDFRWLAVNPRVHTYYPMRTRGCGCIGRPAFPTPSVFRAEVNCKPRTHRAARMRRCVANPSAVITRACG